MVPFACSGIGSILKEISVSKEQPINERVNASADLKPGAGSQVGVVPGDLFVITVEVPAQTNSPSSACPKFRKIVTPGTEACGQE